MFYILFVDHYSTFLPIIILIFSAGTFSFKPMHYFYHSCLKFLPTNVAIVFGYGNMLLFPSANKKMAIIGLFTFLGIKSGWTIVIKDRSTDSIGQILQLLLWLEAYKTPHLWEHSEDWVAMKKLMTWSNGTESSLSDSITCCWVPALSFLGCSEFYKGPKITVSEQRILLAIILELDTKPMSLLVGGLHLLWVSLGPKHLQCTVDYTEAETALGKWGGRKLSQWKLKQISQVKSMGRGEAMLSS